jgi:ankyrin repeat protein
MKKIIYITTLVCLVLASCGKQEDAGTRLFKAIYDNNIDTMKELIAGGIDINGYASDDGDTALTYAILTGTCDMVNLLLDNGAKPNAKQAGDHWDNMSIPLAVTLNKMDTARTLIKHGVGADAKSIRNSTLLIYASCKGYTDLVQALLANGRVDVNHKGGFHNQTALQRAKANGHEDIVQLLTEAGAAE